MKKAILYLRVRTDDETTQEEDWAEQEEILRRYCTAKKIEVAKIYRENCSGGEDFFDRSEFVKLYRHLKRSRSGVNLILFRSMDRFSRNFGQCITMTDVLKHMGVEVKAVEQTPNLKQLIETGYLCKKPSYT